MKPAALVLVGVVALLGLTAHLYSSEDQVLTSAKHAKIDLNQAESKIKNYLTIILHHRHQWKSSQCRNKEENQAQLTG
jgi:hypothetical protein